LIVFIQEDSKLVLVDVCDTLVINVKPTQCPLRLVLLDVGIVAQLGEKDKENFTELFRAVVLGEVSEYTMLYAVFEYVCCRTLLKIFLNSAMS
jgi:predicted unusual protein kinase regulating ubiquinone biosynthesis (AarF/ABC1/UbiB family)